MSQRKSFVFTKDVSMRLARLAGTTRLDSHSAVVRLALIVLEDMVEATAKGEKILVGDRSYSPFVKTN